MCVQKFKVLILSFAAIAILGGCGAMDTILPSSGAYKVNARVNALSVDDYSLVSIGDVIRPFFEYSIADDPDVTALIVFLRDTKGEIRGPRVIYTLDVEKEPVEQENQGNNQNNNQTNNQTGNQTGNQTNQGSNADVNAGNSGNTGNFGETENSDNSTVSLEEDADDKDDETTDETAEQERDLQTEKTAEVLFKDNEEIIIIVRDFDDILPEFPITSNLPVGRYNLVFQVMSKNTILYRTEKPFLYLADAKFDFESIQIHLPGISSGSQLIPQNGIVMLESKLNYDTRFDPYIIWYNGRRVIREGNFSDGNGNLLWKSPEQSGFFALSAEVFPFDGRLGLSGRQRSISLLVSARDVDMNFIKSDMPNILSWYTFEGNLNDERRPAASELALRPDGRFDPLWMPYNGVFGLAAGPKNSYSLPVIPITDSENEGWQIAFCFKPLQEGAFFTVRFGPNHTTVLVLKSEKEKLILSLVSGLETVSQVVDLPVTDSFIISTIEFSVQPHLLFAKLGLMNNPEIAVPPISLEAEIENDFRIFLGAAPEAEDLDYTAIWSEFAVIGISVDFIGEEITEEKLPHAPSILTPPMLAPPDAEDALQG